MKIKLEIKNRFTGKVLFEFETENNTIKETLKQALLSGANLRNADLGGADLGGADLRNADGENIKIEKIVLFDNLYIYQCGVIVSNDGMIYIKLGCFTRLASEWENDFWNNNNEFPNDDSIKSKNRVFAYNVCKMWIENNIVAN